LGVTVEQYFRPSEEAKASENSPFMAHRLAAIDVLIAADSLCRDFPVSCPRLLTERELKQSPVRVRVPRVAGGAGTSSRTVAVIPDAWFQLQVAGDDDEHPVSIALELDRGTEDQQAWRRKVAALSLWATGPYRAAFEAENLTIAVACLDARRRDTLADWTMRELSARSLDNIGDIFLFTAVSPLDVPPVRFFFRRLWRLASAPERVSLLDPPLSIEGEVFVPTG
jgi:hypothetical protein